MYLVYAVLFLIIGLFILAYWTKRRFGVLGLALCAGYVLSGLWAEQVVPYAEQAGIQIATLPIENIIQAVIILLPAVLLLFSGPTYTKQPQRIIGAAAFSLLATAFLLSPLGGSLSLDEMGMYYFNLLVDNKQIIITATIVYAIFDILMLKTPKKKDKD